MIRVAFVQGGAERAGAERVLAALLAHLDRTRIQPTVVFCADGPFVEEVRALGVDVVHAGPAGRLRDLRALPSTLRRIRSALGDAAPDVVQATGEKMAVLCGLALGRRTVPLVAWLHDAPARRLEIATALTQAALARCPAASVVTCSEWMAAAFSRRLRRHVTAIPNGIGIAGLPDEAQGRAALSVACGWPPGTPVVGHVARLERWKGTDVFLRAAALLARRIPEARFVVVGGALFGRDRSWADGLADLVRQLGLDGRVAMLGHRDDVLALMAGLDVVVHASTRADPFPTVVLEAMALGRPVVSTRTSGPDEATGAGDAGLLVPPRDPAALADAVVRLLSDPGLRRRLGRAGRERVTHHYTAERMAADFERHWEGLCAMRRTAP